MSKRCTRCKAPNVADDSPFKTCENCLRSGREYRAANLEQCRAKDRRWHHEHPLNNRAAVKRNAIKHRSWYRDYQARYKREHPEVVRASAANRRARLANAEGSFTHDDVKKQLESQNSICFYCPRHLVKFHVDHKTPLSRGGSNWPSNIVCACAECNMKKNAKTAEEFLSESVRASPSK